MVGWGWEDNREGERGEELEEIEGREGVRKGRERERDGWVGW